MSVKTLYTEDVKTVASFEIDVPAWIEQDITPSQVAAILEGGCASGAYMPAVTYHDASQTMGRYGDEVLQFIEDTYGTLPEIPSGSSWSGIAVHYLSTAVELWAGNIEDELTRAIRNAEDSEDES